MKEEKAKNMITKDDNVMVLDTIKTEKMKKTIQKTKKKEKTAKAEKNIENISLKQDNDNSEEQGNSGDDLLLLDDPKRRKEYLDCMKDLLIQIEDFGFQQEEVLGRNIISHTKYRLKTRDSILAKMERKNRELTEENVFTYINDLAGIRVICLFLDDIYRVRDFIYQIPGITIVKEKDFVKKPKNSGYQSLHMIVQFTNGKKVEIQLRTIGMDFWSVLEYQLQYKKQRKKGKALKKELFSCAIDVRNMDQRMLDLRQSIENV